MAVITCRDLGSIGRFGNQLFLYCFAKGYAEKMGCELQVGPWIGRKIFENANEPIVSVDLPQTEVENESSKPLGYFFNQKDLDIKVFAQHQIYLDFYTRSQVRRWLQLKPEFEFFAPPSNKVYSACHLRRGDYVSDPWLRSHYCEVSERSYDKAIEQFNIPQPVFKVFEGWRDPIYENNTNENITWLADWLLLRDAKHLLRGNSSFSVFAAWAGHGVIYSPRVGNMSGLQDVLFSIGNHENTAGKFANQSDLYIRE